MNDLKTFVFDICRHYVVDNTDIVTEGELKSILGWVRARDIPRLSACSDLFSPAKHGPEHRRFFMQVEAFFKKNALFSDSERCRANAVEAFLKAETACRITNRRLDHYFINRDRLDPDVNMYWCRSERFITSMLGDFRTFLGELPRLVRVTSGATLSRSRRKAHPHLKLSRRPVCTSGAAPYLSALSEWFGYGKISRAKLRNENRIEFVTKNWKTERTIACEPDGNVPLQLAFDVYAKSRLKSKRGIDLSDQSRNQLLALEGSKTGQLATIDMSMASDTIAFNVVASLFPKEWFDYLNAVRSTSGICKDTGRIEYAKFSSMGNGATFSIETMIFASACYAVGSKRFSVYGDDIIIETELVPDLLKYMSFLGFKVNHDKSFWQGPFRESCGSNWHDGVEVTPFYFRELDGRKAIKSHLVNGLVSISSPYGQLATFLKSYVTEEKLPLVPFNRNTQSGVFIDIHSAYGKKVFRWNNFQLQYKAYLPTTQSVDYHDSRGLFLWHLDKNRRHKEEPKELDDRSHLLYRTKYLGLFSKRARERALTSNDPYSYLIRSSYTTSGHKYVRKWVSWQTPGMDTPVHLYWWADLITAE